MNFKQNKYKQRIWVRGCRPEEEEIFQFTMVQVCLIIIIVILVRHVLFPFAMFYFDVESSEFTKAIRTFNK